VKLLVAAIALGAVALLLGVGCGGQSSAGAAGSGKELVGAFGCGGCHAIADVTGADGRVGPSLHGLRHRRLIAGSLPNTPDNAARWIADPKAVDPETLMPDLGVTRSQAQAIVAFLYEH
jgi:cytochrome c